MDDNGKLFFFFVVAGIDIKLATTISRAAATSVFHSLQPDIPHGHPYTHMGCVLRWRQLDAPDAASQWQVRATRFRGPGLGRYENVFEDADGLGWRYIGTPSILCVQHRDWPLLKGQLEEGRIPYRSVELKTRQVQFHRLRSERAA